MMVFETFFHHALETSQMTLVGIANTVRVRARGEKKVGTARRRDRRIKRGRGQRGRVTLLHLS